MDPEDGRSFDEQALWASAALELLGKAALARVSPLLIAEPTEDGTNILIASGLIEGNARFTSVSASTVFKRCQKAFRPFSASDAQKFADARNEYLHGVEVRVASWTPSDRLHALDLARYGPWLVQCAASCLLRAW
jgi:hypothetical protein